MLQDKKNCILIFAPTAEAKKAGKEARREEESPEPTLTIGRKASKSCSSSNFTLVTLLSEFLTFFRIGLKNQFAKNKGTYAENIGVWAC